MLLRFQDRSRAFRLRVREVPDVPCTDELCSGDFRSDTHELTSGIRDQELPRGTELKMDLELWARAQEEDVLASVHQGLEWFCGHRKISSLGDMTSWIDGPGCGTAAVHLHTPMSLHASGHDPSSLRGQEIDTGRSISTTGHRGVRWALGIADTHDSVSTEAVPTPAAPARLDPDVAMTSLPCLRDTVSEFLHAWMMVAEVWGFRMCLETS